MPSRRGVEFSPEVAIVSNNSETLDGLHEFLRAAGVNARGTRDIEDLARVITRTSVAVVLFPDDFEWASVVAAIADLEERSTILPVFVTAHPKQFEDLKLGARAVVVPRPVWGWKIVDAIRAGISRSDDDDDDDDDDDHDDDETDQDDSKPTGRRQP